jgi:hypothetical protein
MMVCTPANFFDNSFLQVDNTVDLHVGAYVNVNVKVA